jgi:hypothetical protein
MKRITCKLTVAAVILSLIAWRPSPTLDTLSCAPVRAANRPSAGAGAEWKPARGVIGGRPGDGLQTGEWRDSDALQRPARA